MKKISTIAAIVVATLSSTAMAGEWFAGIEGGKAYNKVAVSGTDKSESNDKAKSKFYGVKVGKYLDDNIRVYGTLSRNKFNDAKDKDIKAQKSLMLSSDYVFMEGSAVRPFVGGSIGATRLEAGGKSKTGLAYGAQAGVMSQVGPVDLELGLKYVGNNAKLKHDPVQVKLKNSRQAYLSASYRF